MRVPGVSLLAAWMKRNRLTQEACGDRLGFSGVAVSLWLSGDRRPNTDSAFRIEEGTGGEVPASSWRKSARRRSAA